MSSIVFPQLARFRCSTCSCTNGGWRPGGVETVRKPLHGNHKGRLVFPQQKSDGFRGILFSRATLAYPLGYVRWPWQGSLTLSGHFLNVEDEQRVIQNSSEHADEILLDYFRGAPCLQNQRNLKNRMELVHRRNQLKDLPEWHGELVR